MVGRDRELAALAAFLAGLETGPGALVLEGEPGIGKTTLWREGVAQAERAGRLVLAARPSEPEKRLAFAGLADLVSPVVDDLLPQLPSPQRHALEVALLRADSEGVPPDQRTIGVALHGILTRAAGSRPLVIAVDDAQWLDRSSATALGFALRRLRDEPIRLLAFERLGGPGDPSTLGPLLTDADVIRLGPLSLAAVHALLKHRLGRSLPRPRLLRLYQACAGNPFFALEIAELLLTGGAGAAAPLPMPADLSQLVVRRLGKLTATARLTLLVTAAAARPTVGLIEAAVGSEGTPALEKAEARGILQLGEREVRFSHPLYAAAVYSSASDRQRRQAHRRLAEVVDAPEEQARHLALSSLVPDEHVASALERAAARAASRAAPADAADLMELAWQRTPDPETSLRRRVALAELASRAGDTSHARETLEAVIADAEPGPMRARARITLAGILHSAGTPTGAVELCETALDEAGEDPELRAAIHTTLAFVDYDDFRRAEYHLRLALELLSSLETPDPVLYSQALHAFCGSEVEQGRAPPAEAVERGLELESQARPAAVADRFSAAVGVWLKYMDDFDGARNRLEATYRSAVDEGDDGSLPYALSHLPQLEIWSGNWARAAEVAHEHLVLAEQTEQESQRRQARFNLAYVYAHQGRVEEARAEIAENLAAADSDGDTWTCWTTLGVLGFLELSLGRAEEALRQLRKAAELRDAAGDVVRCWYEPDLIESLLEAGQVDAARRVLDRYESRALAARRHSALANAARCRGLAAAAAGDVGDALRELDAALAKHDAADIPFDRARTLLAKGKVERRAKRKAAAKQSLDRAHAIFDELGAALWAAKARDELARLGLRQRAEGLTATEGRVAELAAAGLRNREVAAKLFMSPKTVEANLARVYRKLGVASRAELGARWERSLRTDLGNRVGVDGVHSERLKADALNRPERRG